MGAWGSGPFDSDSGLDLLDGLTNRYAERDEDDEVVPGSVQVEEVVRSLAQTLTQYTRDGESLQVDASSAYAAAGLVAAVLAGHTEGNTGTRLFAGSGTDDPLGLANHCGNTALLPREHAKALVPDATRAVETILRDREWLSTWNDPQEVRRSLRTLAGVLEVHQSGAVDEEEGPAGEG